MNRSDRFQQFVAEHLLQQVSARANLKSPVDVLIAMICRDDDEPAGWCMRISFGRLEFRLQAVARLIVKAVARTGSGP